MKGHPHIVLPLNQPGFHYSDGIWKLKLAEFSTGLQQVRAGENHPHELHCAEQETEDQRKDGACPVVQQGSDSRETASCCQFNH